MLEIAGTTYFFQLWGVFVLVLLVPVLWWLSSRWVRWKLPDRTPMAKVFATMGGTAILLVLSVIGMYWDVYLIGQRAKVLCEQTGLKVYRTVEAEGFLGENDIEYWNKYGFKYVEFEDRYVWPKPKFYRYTLDSNDQKRKEEVAAPISRYEFMQLERLPVAKKFPDNHFAKARLKIIDRVTGEMIAEYVFYNIYPGWVDGFFLSRTGLTFIPWSCRSDKSVGPVHKLIISTIKPAQLSRGGNK